MCFQNVIEFIADQISEESEIVGIHLSDFLFPLISIVAIQVF